MIEHLADARHIIDRLDLPARVRTLVTQIEEKTGPLDKVTDKAGAEISRVLALVGGDALCQAIVARLVEQLPEEEEGVIEPTDRIRSQWERWHNAALSQDNLVLLREGDSYIAYNEQAERIAAATGSHHFVQGRRTMVSLKESNSGEWIQQLQDANLDVALVEETSDGDGGIKYAVSQALDIGRRDPLDHDGNGHKGGSLAGDQSTAHKGKVNKQNTETPA